MCVTYFELGLVSGNGLGIGPDAAGLQRDLDCAATAASCDDVLQCASSGHGPDWCNAHDQWGCDADVLVTCSSGWGLWPSDCAADGEHCLTQNGASTCSNGTACDPSSRGRCDGNRFIYCHEVAGLESSVDCGTVFPGGRCDSDVGCLPPASPDCTTDGARCNGKVVVDCSHGSASRTDCAALASHCGTDEHGTLTCIPDATQCPLDAPDSCNGDSLEICVNGMLMDTPCASIGLQTCQVDDGHAHCR
jgi:hypothetical protein